MKKLNLLGAISLLPVLAACMPALPPGPIVCWTESGAPAGYPGYINPAYMHAPGASPVMMGGPQGLVCMPIVSRRVGDPVTGSGAGGTGTPATNAPRPTETSTTPRGTGAYYDPATGTTVSTVPSATNPGQQVSAVETGTDTGDTTDSILNSIFDDFGMNRVTD